MTSGPRRRPSTAEACARRAQIDDPAVVLEAAARFLDPRARSVVEVRRRLTGAGYRRDLVDSAVERMLELEMLDDESFARAWVESRDRRRPRGERAIRAELGLKGVDRATVDLVLGERRAALPDGGPDDGEPLLADLLAAERLLALHRRNLERVADPRQRRQRAYQLLARNGFDPETCREAAARFDRDPGDEDEQR